MKDEQKITGKYLSHEGDILALFKTADGNAWCKRKEGEHWVEGYLPDALFKARVGRDMTPEEVASIAGPPPP